MSATHSFYIIPWNNNFLEELHSLIDKLTHSTPSKAVVVFSNARPKRYLIDIYKNKANAPIILPNIITLEQLIDIFMKSWEEEIPRAASLLDQIFLLKETILDASNSLSAEAAIKNMSKKLQETDGMSFFYPWATHLSALLEECARQCVAAQNLIGISDMVLPPAAAILSSLKCIQEIFQQKLQERGLSTPGRNLQKIALKASKTPLLPLPAILQNKIIILAGFLKLNASENLLFHYLWENGAYICLDTDPKILEGKAHWSCHDHIQWIKKWNADLTLYGKVRETIPNINFFSAYNLHSQLIELRTTIAKRADKENNRSAIVLCRDELLMPTLHHIKEKEINISLGYPLSRTLFFRLLEKIFNLRMSQKKDCSVNTIQFREILRHPYIQQLGITLETDNTVISLKNFLNDIEKELDREGNYADIRSVSARIMDKNPLRTYPVELSPLTNEIINILVNEWAEIDTLQKLADVLNKVVHFLLTYDKHIWKRFPLDLECLAILTEKIIPQLAENALSSVKLTHETLFNIAKHFLAEQRIPFHADPLTGLQIMGTLETRHLHFDNVYYLDLTEDAVPGKQQYDPLMPENLRLELGLSDTKHKDYIAAYSFYRMLAGAKNVFLFWQEGSGAGLFDDKKSKSRFIEEELWKIEQKKGRVLKKGDYPYNAAVVPSLSPAQPIAKSILRTDTINKILLERITGENKTISAKFLDAYMQCPVKFFHGTLCRVSENEEWSDKEDFLGVGNILHKTLQDVYGQFIGREISKGVITQESLIHKFFENFSHPENPIFISPGSRYFLEAAIPYIIRKYLDNQPERLNIAGLEYSLSLPITIAENTYSLYGKMDRIDNRAGEIIILDYKSGKSIPKPEKGFWSNDVLDKIEKWMPESTEDPLPEIADRLQSIQLPLYLYLIIHTENFKKIGSKYNAAWVQLAGSGKEEYLFSNEMDEEEKQEIIKNKIPRLLNFIFRHLLHSKEFKPHEGIHCRHCSFRLLCRN